MSFRILNLFLFSSPPKVRFLTSLNGKNELESLQFTKHKQNRINYSWIFTPWFYIPIWWKSNSKFPGSLYSGSAYFMFTKKAVEVILSNEDIQELFQWSHDAKQGK